MLPLEVLVVFLFCLISLFQILLFFYLSIVNLTPRLAGEGAVEGPEPVTAQICGEWGCSVTFYDARVGSTLRAYIILRFKCAAQRKQKKRMKTEKSRKFWCIVKMWYICQC